MRKKLSTNAFATKKINCTKNDNYKSALKATAKYQALLRWILGTVTCNIEYAAETRTTDTTAV